MKKDIKDALNSFGGTATIKQVVTYHRGFYQNSHVIDGLNRMVASGEVKKVGFSAVGSQLFELV